jgi:DNA-binding transcriptional MerR regulator
MRSGSFSTHEVLQLTGATARQLQWWDEHRLIVPERDGRKRAYSPGDLADIVVVLELRRRRVPLQRVRRALVFLREKLNARFADLVGEESDHQLLIDGDRLYLETEAQQIFDLLKNSEQAVLVISLAETVGKIRVADATLTLTRADLGDSRKPPTAAIGETERRKEAAKRARA